MGARVLKIPYGHGKAPVTVTKSAEHRHHDQGESDEVRIGTPRQGHAQQKSEQPTDRLLRPSKWKHGEEVENSHRRQQEDKPEEPGEDVFSGSDFLPKACCGHLSLQRTPRYPLVAGAAWLFTHPARLPKSSAAAELG